MKTKMWFAIGLLGLFASCTSNTCKIEGTVQNAQDGDTLFMARMTNGKFVPSDTIVLQNGKFSLQEKCDSTVIASYFYHNKQNDEVYSNIFFMEKGNVQLTIGPDGKAIGTESNDIYQSLSDSVFAIHQQMNALYSQHIPTDADENFTPDSLTEQKLVELDQKANQILKSHVEKYIATPCGYFLLLSCYDMFEPAQIVELAGQVPAQYKNDTALRFLMEEAQKSGKTANGTSFIDVIIPSIDGGELKLSDIVKQNKLTLVDCWASWCGPCRAEMPHVVELYAKYHEKGLEIVGISFDEEEEAWKEAVKEMNMTWPQGSELQSWDNVMTQLYNVTSIPYTILIDQNGTIVAQQLRGHELEEAVKEHLE